jgi:hypothetical protein
MVNRTMAITTASNPPLTTLIAARRLNGARRIARAFGWFIGGQSRTFHTLAVGRRRHLCVTLYGIYMVSAGIAGSLYCFNLDGFRLGLSRGDLG